MCFSRSLLRLHSTEIGLKLFHSDPLRDLLMGETLPIFHVDAKVPVAILRSSNLLMVLDKTGTLHRIDQLSLYLEVFSFKFRAAWSDRLENYILKCSQKDNKSNLHDFLLYINVIISYSFRVCGQHGAWMNAAIFIRHCESFEHSRCDWLNHTMWSHGNC